MLIMQSKEDDEKVFYFFFIYNYNTKIRLLLKFHLNKINLIISLHFNKFTSQKKIGIMVNKVHNN